MVLNVHRNYKAYYGEGGVWRRGEEGAYRKRELMEEGGRGSLSEEGAYGGGGKRELIATLSPPE